MKCKKLFKYEIIGIFIIFFIGCLWHNLYDILGNNVLIGLIAPVNESMWEHWKIGLYPILIYSIIEYIFVKGHVKNFLFSRFIVIVVFEIICFSLVGLWHILFKEASFTTNMIVDIATYFIGILIGQLAGYFISCKTKENKTLFYIAVVGIAIHIIIFILFTFNPPMIEYFKDSITGQYGL
jgi:Family of unknown function (DUF6512)